MNTGLYLFANLLGGGVAEVFVTAIGEIRFAVGGALAPVDINAPVASQRRVMAAAKRHGYHTVNMVTLSPVLATKAGLYGGGTGQGLYESLADAIRNDNRLDRMSKHDRKALVALVQERYAQ